MANPIIPEHSCSVYLKDKQGKSRNFVFFAREDGWIHYQLFHGAGSAPTEGQVQFANPSGGAPVQIAAGRGQLAAKILPDPSLIGLYLITKSGKLQEYLFDWDNDVWSKGSLPDGPSKPAQSTVADRSVLTILQEPHRVLISRGDSQSKAVDLFMFNWDGKAWTEEEYTMVNMTTK